MSDPISRLQFACQEIDREFGTGGLRVMLTAANDFAALTIARAIETVADALAEPEERPEQGIVPVPWMRS